MRDAKLSHAKNGEQSDSLKNRREKNDTDMNYS